ncbi:MAG TPA: glycoside hydrolase family 2 TIM barrel-domain containing protein [Opitutaceae bacterium]|nr:glycoside hydrolase family 2 TIM barrel-domain containing protein [Opitutaceae bacterium]
MSTPNFAPRRGRAFRFTLTLAIFAALVTHAFAAAPSAARNRQSFDRDWRFHLGDTPGAEQTEFADTAWRTLDVPHDWSIEGPFDQKAPTGGSGGYLPTGMGWYRKSFTVPETERGRRLLIQFDGIYQHSTVWINGHELGTRPYGYSTFSYDLTPYVKFGGSNVLAVRVDNASQPNSRWYSGSGIYRHTWLTITDTLAIAPNGIYITTPEISKETALVRVRTRVHNAGTTSRRFELATRVLEGAGQRSPSSADGMGSVTESRELAPGAEVEIESVIQVRAPRLWSTTTPELYRLRAEILADQTVIDATETTFGIRQIEYDVDRGFLLNGTAVKLKGMCLHHDGGAVGAAVPEAVLERRLRLLQEMGCNAIRCSHNPMAPEFYDLCDRLGLLVMDEAFDEWTIRKPQIKFGYSDVFNEWFERDLVDFIRQDRNHPCVVMWSAGNEIGEQRAPNGPEVLRKLVEIFHREDPTRPVTAAMDNIFNGNGQAPVAFSGLLDVVGYNYVDRWGSRRETFFGDDRTLFPQRKFVGTEDTNPHGTRGEYHFGPLLGGGFVFEGGETPRTYGPEGALYLTNTIRAAALWRFIATHDYVTGDFGWTGVDYLGESRWPRRIATSGVLDTCGFKKDTYYFYQSLWTDAPMLHLLPHWNWPERIGKPVPVVAYSNCAAIELFLNGRSLGAKAREFPAQGTSGGWNSYALPQVQSTTSDLQFSWDVIYEPGELKAVGYDRSGKVVATTTIQTAGPARTIEATVDRTTLAADRRDVAHVTIRALDEHGVFVPLANDVVTFEVSGRGKLLAVDNGDPTSHEPYQTNSRALFNGMALALVQATDEPGSIQVVARAKGLREATVTIATH